MQYNKKHGQLGDNTILEIRYGEAHFLEIQYPLGQKYKRGQYILDLWTTSFLQPKSVYGTLGRITTMQEKSAKHMRDRFIKYGKKGTFWFCNTKHVYALKCQFSENGLPMLTQIKTALPYLLDEETPLILQRWHVCSPFIGPKLLERELPSRPGRELIGWRRRNSSPAIQSIISLTAHLAMVVRKNWELPIKPMKSQEMGEWPYTDGATTVQGENGLDGHNWLGGGSIHLLPCTELCRWQHRHLGRRRFVCIECRQTVWYPPTNLNICAPRLREYAVCTSFTGFQVWCFKLHVFGSSGPVFIEIWGPLSPNNPNNLTFLGNKSWQ